MSTAAERATGLGPDGREPLAGHVVYRTAHPERAVAAAAAYFTPHKLVLPERGHRFSARMNACRVGTVLLTYLAYGVELTLRSQELDGLTVVILPLSGRMALVQGGREVVATTGTGCVVRPDQPHTLHWGSGLTVLTLAFDHADLGRHLGRLAGAPTDGALRFEPAVAPAARATVWAGIAHTMTSLVADAGPGGPPPPAGAEISRAAMTTLLLSQPHNHRDAVTATAGAAAPAAVRRTAELLRSDPAADHHVGALAEAAGVSARSLQAGFRKLYGMSPTQFLRDVRLDTAHRALAAADPDGSTVAAIATRSGFGHLGRFAVDYRRRFGQSPSVTLRTGSRMPDSRSPRG